LEEHLESKIAEFINKNHISLGSYGYVIGPDEFAVSLARFITEDTTHRFISLSQLENTVQSILSGDWFDNNEHPFYDYLNLLSLYQNDLSLIIDGMKLHKIPEIDGNDVMFFEGLHANSENIVQQKVRKRELKHDRERENTRSKKNDEYFNFEAFDDEYFSKLCKQVVSVIETQRMNKHEIEDFLNKGNDRRDTYIIVLFSTNKWRKVSISKHVLSWIAKHDKEHEDAEFTIIGITPAELNYVYDLRLWLTMHLKTDLNRSLADNRNRKYASLKSAYRVYRSMFSMRKGDLVRILSLNGIMETEHEGQIIIDKPELHRCVMQYLKERKRSNRKAR